MIKLINILKEIIEGTCGYTTDANTNKKLKKLVLETQQAYQLK